MAAFVALELLGGVMLLVWRKAGRALSHALDLQHSRIGAHFQAPALHKPLP
ncbi:hypothetical protein [Deinococcus cavernae]|uniref:hypothetical protein n=1 Tax=Deinococcus cavernae TaxID=2320857 RepID=UPI001314B1E9|nr:hypothetical protein [Deinococcus cavernae]